MTLVIRENDIRALISPSEALECVRSAHRDMALGQVHNVPRTRARALGMGLHQLSAASNALGMSASKVYSATRDAVRSFITLFDSSSGELLAIIAANELGRLRTAAASVLAAQVLCKPPCPTVALIGSGFQAEGIIEALATVRTELLIERILVFSRNSENLAEFVLSTSAEYNIVVSATSSAEAAAREAELIFTTTTSSRPVLEASWIPQAQCVCSLGANSLSRSELDPRIVTTARRVVVDARDVAALEGGSLLAPIENGKLLWSQVTELGDLLVSDKAGREVNARGSFDLFCSHGLAAQDLYVARQVYDKARTSASNFSQLTF